VRSVCWTSEKSKGAEHTYECPGGTWSCNNWDECLIDTGRTENRCAARINGDELVQNPLENIKAEDASQIARSALSAGVTGLLGTIVPTALSATISTTAVAGVTSVNDIPATDSARLGTALVSVLATGGSTPTAAATPASTAGSQGTSDSDSDEEASTSSATAAGSTSTAALHSEPAMSSSTLSNGAIAGIAVGGAAVLILFAIVAFLIYRRRKRRSRALAAARDQSLEDDALETKLEPSTFHDTHHDTPHDTPQVAPQTSFHDIPLVAPQTTYHDAHHNVTPAPAAIPSRASSVGARSIGGQSAVSAVSALSVLSPVSPVDAPPSPMLAAVKQGPSHLVAEQHAPPERPVSPLMAEAQHPSEGEALISALEPSPLQTLMMHGKYPPDRE
jgi:hypothetical protein